MTAKLSYSSLSARPNGSEAFTKTKKKSHLTFHLHCRSSPLNISFTIFHDFFQYYFHTLFQDIFSLHILIVRSLFFLVSLHNFSYFLFALFFFSIIQFFVIIYVPYFFISFFTICFLYIFFSLFDFTLSFHYCISLLFFHFVVFLAVSTVCSHNFLSTISMLFLILVHFHYIFNTIPNTIFITQWQGLCLV